MMRSPQRYVCRSMDFRAEPSTTNDGRTMQGYTAVFRQPTLIDSWEGLFWEQIARGAFTKTLTERTPVVQFDHGRDMRTGSVPIAVLDQAEERSKGLWTSASLFDNPVVEPIRQAIAGGAITGQSFRFEVVRDEWRSTDGKLLKGNDLADLLWGNTDEAQAPQRTIREVKLFELGPVVFPAYTGTSVGVRMMLDDLSEDERGELLAELRERYDIRERQEVSASAIAAPRTSSYQQTLRRLQARVWSESNA